jgi:hypothetical protein
MGNRRGLAIKNSELHDGNMQSLWQTDPGLCEIMSILPN